MALPTVTVNDPITKFVTSGGYGAVAMDGLLYFVGVGTTGISTTTKPSTVLYLRNQDVATAATSQGKPTYTVAHADQDKFTVAGTRPA